MPELPEIEIIKRGLVDRIIGKTISRFEVRWPKIFLGQADQLSAKNIVAIRRLGKLLIIVLDDQSVLLVHLRMTGQLVYQASGEAVKIVGGHPQKSYNQPLPHQHTHAIIHFEDNSRIYYNDLRKFGRITHMPKRAVRKVPFVATLGPDALSAQFNYQYLRPLIARRPKCSVYTFLLDQQVVAGIGNIYVNEALYQSGILPSRAIAKINLNQWQRLFAATKSIMRKSIALGGSTDNTYRDIEGRSGTYLQQAFVYRQKSDPKGHPVKRIKLSGRSAHFCPICQK